MNELRLVVLWVWLMVSLVRGSDVEAIAAYLVLAAGLFAAERWSRTVRRQSAAALLLLDAPVLFTLQRHQQWPPVTGAIALLGILLVGAWTTRRQWRSLS